MTRKLADHIDGVDLSARSVGDVVDFPTTEAQLLLAEEWATSEERRQRQAAIDRRFDRRHSRRLDEKTIVPITLEIVYRQA